MTHKAIIGNPKASFMYRSLNGEDALARDIEVHQNKIIICSSPSEQTIHFALMPKCEILFKDLTRVTVNGSVSLYFNKCNLDPRWHNGKLNLYTSELDAIASDLQLQGIRVEKVKDPLNKMTRNFPWQDFYSVQVKVGVFLLVFTFIFILTTLIIEYMSY